MKKYQNKLDNINKRIEAIRENSFYCDYDYKLKNIESDFLKTKDFDRFSKEKLYLSLRFEELERELYTLLDLQEGYEELVK